MLHALFCANQEKKKLNHRLELTAGDPVASTGGAVLVLFDRSAFAADVSVFAFEIICVTGGAVGCVCGPGP